MPTIITRSAYLAKSLSYAETAYKEGPDNANRFSKLLGRDNEAWCADFECGVAAELDSKGWTELLPNTASCLMAIAEWKKRGRWYRGYAGIQPGDIAYIGPNGGQHTFVVVQLLAAGRILTCEGNTNNNGSANGDGVYRRTRPLQVIYGYGRPNYAPEPMEPVVQTTYKVKSGDNWQKISDSQKISLSRLRELNGGKLGRLKKDDVIRLR